jgi:hypothetical protein
VICGALVRSGASVRHDADDGDKEAGQIRVHGRLCLLSKLDVLDVDRPSAQAAGGSTIVRM